MQAELTKTGDIASRIPTSHETAKRVLRNIFSLTIAEFVVRASSLATSMFLARMLTVDDIGIIAFAGASVGYLTLIVGFGLDTIALREIAKTPGHVKCHVATVLGMRSMLAVAGATLLGVYLTLLNKPAGVKVIIAIVASSAILGSLITANFAYQALNRTGILAVRTFIGAIVNLALIFIFVRHTTPLWVVVALTAGANIGTAILFAASFIREFGIPWARIDRAVAKDWLYSAVPIALSSLCIMVYYQFDTILMGLWRSEREVGLYTSAYRVIFLLAAMQLMVNQSAIPTLSNLYAHDKRKLRRFVAVMMTVMAGMSLLVTAGTWVMAGPAIKLLYGSKFAGSMPVLKTLSWTMTLVYNECITAPLLYAAGKQIAHLKCVAMGAAINTLANFLLIPRFGMQGAAIATIIAEGAVFTLLTYYASTIVELPLARMLKIAIAGALALVAFLAPPLLALPIFCVVILVATWSQVRHDVPLRQLLVRSQYT